VLRYDIGGSDPVHKSLNIFSYDAMFIRNPTTKVLSTVSKIYFGSGGGLTTFVLSERRFPDPFLTADDFFSADAVAALFRRGLVLFFRGLKSTFRFNNISRASVKSFVHR
jgi:hypothetical protein